VSKSLAGPSNFELDGEECMYLLLSAVDDFPERRYCEFFLQFKNFPYLEFIERQDVL
jgi:hypothetical protein